MAVWLQGGQVAVQMQEKKGGKVAGFRRRNYGKKLFADRGLEGNSRAQIAGLEETGAV